MAHPKGSSGNPKGRPVGSLNRNKQEIIELCKKHGLTLGEVSVLIVLNKLPCGVCRGKGKTPFKTESGDIKMRTCESCYGRLFESCTPELRGRKEEDLMGYVYAKRKAMEVSGGEDEDGPVSIKVEFIRAQQTE